MSDPIRSNTQAQVRLSQKLQRKQSQELESLSKRHQAEVSDVKRIQAQDLAEIRDQHQREIAEQVDRKEKGLEALRDSLEKTRKLTERESQQLLARTQEKRSATLAQSNDELQRVTNAYADKIDDVNIRQNDVLQDLYREGQLKSAEIQDRNRVVAQTQEQEWQGRIDQQRQQFGHTYQSEAKKFETLTRQQQDQSQRQIKDTQTKNETRLSTMNQQHVALEEKLTNQNQKSLSEKEQYFEKKYQRQQQQHFAAEKHLQELQDRALAKTKDDLNQRVTVEQRRSSDAFFAFTEMPAKLEERPEAYVLRVRMPEYAKEEVQVTVNQKELVVTSNRRYQDERRDQDGVVRKVNKVESLVSRLPVDSVLNPKKVTKEWVDGEVVFTVQKA